MTTTAKDRPDIQALIDEYKTVRGLVNHDPKIPRAEVTTVALVILRLLLQNKDTYLDIMLKNLEDLRDERLASKVVDFKGVTHI